MVRSRSPRAELTQAKAPLRPAVVGGASGKRVSRSSFGCSLGFASLLVLQRCVSEGIFQGLLSLTKRLKLHCFAKISLFLFFVDFFFSCYLIDLVSGFLPSIAAQPGRTADVMV